jgi:hypothetical protein
MKITTATDKIELASGLRLVKISLGTDGSRSEFGKPGRTWRFESKSKRIPIF